MVRGPFRGAFLSLWPFGSPGACPRTAGRDRWVWRLRGTQTRGDVRAIDPASGFPAPPGSSPPPRATPRPRRPVFLRVRLCGRDPPPRRLDPPQKVTSPPRRESRGAPEHGADPRSAPPRPAARARARALRTSLALSRRLHLGFSVAGLGLRLFSRAESRAQLLLSAGSARLASPFPRIFPGSRNPGAQLSQAAGLGVA